MPAEITSPPFHEYALKFTSPEGQSLHELNQETQKLRGAQMISGHLQGTFLQMISKMIQPKNVLEIGTYTGYSAICLAAGLQEDGKVHTIDNEDTHQDLREKYWLQSGFQNQIVQHIGDAQHVISEIQEDFDLIFIDADKKNYGLYFDLLIEKVKSGTWFLADNVLFHGEVILPSEKQSKNAKYMHAFNQKIAGDNRVEQVLLPIRDGLTIIRKI